MSTVTDPGERIRRLTGVSLGGILTAWIILGLFTSPVIYHFLSFGPQMLGLVVLGIFGWGIWFGQQLLQADFREDIEEMREGIDEKQPYIMPILSIINVAYYNIVLFSTVVIAAFIGTNGYPEIATVFAFVYPAYDMAIVDRGYPLSIAGILAILIAVGIVLANLGEMSWREIDFGDVLYRVIDGGRYGLN